MSTPSENNTRIDDTADFDRRALENSVSIADTDRWQFSRYDLFLFLLPLPLLLGVTWATVTAAPVSAGVNLGSVPTLALLAYGGGPTSS